MNCILTKLHSIDSKSIFKCLLINRLKNVTNVTTIRNKFNPNHELVKQISKYKPSIRKRINRLDLTQISRYEHEFQEKRQRQLSPIDPKQYRDWLYNWCSERSDTSIGYHQKLDKVEMICRLYNQFLDTSGKVPTSLTVDHMRDLLELDTEREARVEINFMFDKELKRWIEKKFENQVNMENKLRLDLKNMGNTSRIGVFNQQNEIIYGLWHNTLFMRITKRRNRKMIRKTRLKNSALFGQKVCIDFSFEEYLNNFGAKLMMGYLANMFVFNQQKLSDSFDLSFCNLNPTGNASKLFPLYFGDRSPIENYINTSSDSYLKHFDFDKLCYICPQAEEPLKTYDNNAVYILPAVAHSRMDPPLSMMRVKLEGIQMKRIPIEDYAPIRAGFHLELLNSLQILSHFRDHNDMSKAIELYLPKTVWQSEQEVEDDDEEVAKKLFYMKMLEQQKKSKFQKKIYTPEDTFD